MYICLQASPYAVLTCYNTSVRYPRTVAPIHQQRLVYDLSPREETMRHKVSRLLHPTDK